MPRANLTLMTRSPTTAYDVRDLTDAQVAARERVARALDALGGHGSPAASCVWQVVGMQTSIREWAASARLGWPTRQPGKRAGDSRRSARRAREALRHSRLRGTAMRLR
jgi:hypothetical protein